MSEKERYQWYAKDVAYKHKVPFRVFHSLITQESGWNPTARSYVGALGIAQFMPATARRYGLKVNSNVDERRNPYKSLDAAARYLKDNHKLFGNWEHTVASYNAGEGDVKKYGGIPPYKETQNYVKAIFAMAGRFEKG